MLFKYKGKDLNDVMLECDAATPDPREAVISVLLPQEDPQFDADAFVEENIDILTLLCGEAHRQWLEAQEELPGEAPTPPAGPSVQ